MTLSASGRLRTRNVLNVLLTDLLIPSSEITKTTGSQTIPAKRFRWVWDFPFWTDNDLWFYLKCSTDGMKPGTSHKTKQKTVPRFSLLLFSNSFFFFFSVYVPQGDTKSVYICAPCICMWVLHSCWTAHTHTLYKKITDSCIAPSNSLLMRAHAHTASKVCVCVCVLVSLWA